jgi:hypothetical protein
VLLDQPLREKMKERSYRQAAKFSWETSVRRIIEVYQEFPGAGKPSGPSGGSADARRNTTAGLA